MSRFATGATLLLSIAMAEFCNRCAEKHGFHPDFDVEAIAKKLKKGERISVLCEGCGLVGIWKDGEGEMRLVYWEN